MKNEQVFIDVNKGYVLYWKDGEAEVRTYLSGETLIKIIDEYTKEKELSQLATSSSSGSH
jgi:hypothetical protein